MRIFNLKNSVALILLFSLLTFNFSCTSSKNTITIGSKNFTEQIILGEIMAQLIENHTDLKVKRKFNLGGTFICFNALKQGEIDIYPEYTGTGLTAILKMDVITDKDKSYKVVRDEFEKQYSLIWLKPFGLNNTYTITMRDEQANSLGINKVSDIKKHIDILKSGFTSEFMERPDGYNGLIKRYNLNFKIEPFELDPGLMYKAVKEKEVDIICGFATDGRIPAYNLKVLKDDKNYFPPYYAAPIIRKETIDKYPELKNILNKLNNQITDDKISQMNYEVDQGNSKVKNIAQSFLNKNNL